MTGCVNLSHFFISEALILPPVIDAEEERAVLLIGELDGP